MRRVRRRRDGACCPGTRPPRWTLQTPGEHFGLKCACLKKSCRLQIMVEASWSCLVSAHNAGPSHRGMISAAVAMLQRSFGCPLRTTKYVSRRRADLLPRIVRPCPLRLPIYAIHPFLLFSVSASPRGCGGKACVPMSLDLLPVLCSTQGTAVEQSHCPASGTIRQVVGIQAPAFAKPSVIGPPGHQGRRSVET